MPTSRAVKGDIRILVVDDHPIVRKGLVELFDEQPGLTVCGEAGTVAEAVAAAIVSPPDVAVVDLTLGLESGLDLLTLLAASHPAVRVLVLSGHDEKLYAERALKAGALGYIMKDRAATELLAAVRHVATGKSYVSVETAERILSTLGAPRRGTADTRSPLERLSDREHHVLALLGEGLSTSEIAEKLEISVKTVESHFAHLKEKLGARNGRELMRLAVSWSCAS
jgi:DNA-binding NarL/FixJ family response regulator